MRYLAWFSFPFALGCAIGTYSRASIPQAAIAAGVLLLCCALCAALKRVRLRAAALALAGIAAGMLWCASYRAVVYGAALDVPEGQTELTGTVCEAPVTSDYGAYVTIRAERDGHLIKTRLYLPDDGAELRPGDRITATVTLQNVAATSSESAVYLSAKGVLLTAHTRGAYESQRPEKVPLRDRPALWRAAICARIERIFPEDTAAFMTALLTSEHATLSDADSSVLRICGVYHVVAVSGMHVSILLGFLLLAFHGHRVRALIGIPAAALFVAFIGGSPGTMRAGIVYAFALAAPLFRREADSPTSLGAALLAMLVANPMAIANVSLQLSFAATAGILLFYRPVDRALCAYLRVEALHAHCRPAAWVLRGALGVLSTTLSALVLTMPLMAYWFGTISLIAPLANLLVVPVISACFVLGLAAVGLSFVWLPAAGAAAWAASVIVRYILAVCRLLSRVPYAQVSATSPYLLMWLLFAYVVLVLVLAFRSLRRSLLPACVLALTLALCLLCANLSHAGVFGAADGEGAVSVTALDVGQGQCIVLESSGICAVVDCGGDDSPGERCAQYLLDGGVRALDALIVTHFDSDHIGGIAELLERVTVSVVYMPSYSEDASVREMLTRTVSEAGASVCTVTEDLLLSFADGTVTIFAPVSRANDNDAGLSVLLSCGEFDALVTGDMATALEERLLSLHELPDIEVLVAGHHGSRYSTGERLLAETKPEIVLISVGENRYGHPAGEMLQRAARAGAEVYRTDQCGSITVRR